MPEPTFRQYVSAWSNAFLKGAWDQFGALTTAAGFALWLWIRKSPASLQASAAYLGITPEQAMSDWVWLGPVAVGLLALGYRFVRAPYEIHLATLKTHQVPLGKARAALEETRAELAKAQGQNHGIELKCSGLALTWESDPELPSGVLVAVDVDRLVNGNTQDAAIDVKLVVPIWRGRGFAVNTTARPSISVVSVVKSTLPQLPPIINLARKQAIGPGVFLFFFALDSLKEMPMLPRSQREMVLEDFAKLISESEMQIEMTDLANQITVPPVLAPGTLGKQVRRLKSERKDAAEQSRQ